MPPADEPEDDLDDQGGDPACWLDRVCDACGALVDADDHVCDQARPARR